MNHRFSSRWACLAGSAMLAAAVVSGAAVAAPHDPGVVPLVLPTPGTVTLTRAGQPINASYRVTIQNGTTNNLNAVSLTGTTVVRGGTDANAAVIEAQVIPTSTNCGLDTPTKITCSIGTLPPGGNLTFVVVVKSPVTGASIDFNWTFAGSEGNSTNGCCITQGTATTTLVDALTNESAKRHVQSFVKAAGGTFFTGATGVATQADPWTTTVTVPDFSSMPLQLYTTADVTETELLASCSAVNLKCNQSLLTIPGTFGNLEITLQQHPSIIKTGSKIENWVIAYSKNPGNLLAYPYFNLQRCSATAVAPVAGTPCIDTCKEYTRKSDPLTPAKWGIFECKIKAIDNGGYTAP